MARVKKEDIVGVMEKLAAVLTANHSDSPTAKYVSEALIDLRKSDGVAFTGAVQQFFDRAQVVRISDHIVFTDEETELWDHLFAFKQLGNNLWGLSI